MTDIDLTVNFDDVEPMTGGGPLPEGEYVMKIVEAKAIKSSRATPGIEVKFEVAQGDHLGRVQYDRLWLTSKALGVVLAKLQSVHYPLPQGTFRLDPSKLLGRRCSVVVRHEEYEGKTNGRVAGWNEIPGANGSSDPLAGGGLPATEFPAPTANGSDDDIPF